LAPAFTSKPSIYDIGSAYITVLFLSCTVLLQGAASHINMALVSLAFLLVNDVLPDKTSAACQPATPPLRRLPLPHSRLGEPQGVRQDGEGGAGEGWVVDDVG